MKFIVSDLIKTLVLRQVGRPVYPGNTVKIDDPEELDVQLSIEKGFLIPLDENGVPEYSVVEDKEEEDTDEETEEEVEEVKENPKKVKIVSPQQSQSKPEQKETKAVVWDARKKSVVNAPLVPKSIEADLKDDNAEVKFINQPKETEQDKDDSPLVLTKIKGKNEISTKSMNPKTAGKKNTKRDKIGTSPKVKIKETSGKTKKIRTADDVKTVDPVGEVKPTLTVADAAIELDSNGNPLSMKDAGEMLRHMIDSIDSGQEVSFVDQEQTAERFAIRNRLNNIDLDD